MIKIFKKLTGGKVSKTYWGRFKDRDGKTLEIDLGVENNKTAYAVYRELQLQVLYDDAMKHEKLSLLIASFIENQRATGHSEKYVRQQEKHLKRVFDYCSWVTIDEINIEGFEEWRSKVCMSANTKNHYLASLSCFAQWAFVRKHIGENPFRRCKKIRVYEPLKNRRALSRQEINKLIATASNPALYIMAISTGLRKGELEKLTWKDIDLERKFVRVRASIGKNRKLVHLPLTARLIKSLKRYKKNCNDSDFVFGKIGEKWIKDYENAGIERNSDNVRCDFHSLRVTFLTLLVLEGVHPRSCQELARHSSINLTMKIYIDMGKIDNKNIVKCLDNYFN